MPCGMLQAMSWTTGCNRVALAALGWIYYTNRSGVQIIITLLNTVIVDELKSVNEYKHKYFATLFHWRSIVWLLLNLQLWHITAASYARPVILLPVQSASLLSQQAAPRLLQLHCPSVICTSTQMRPAWVICVKIRQIKKYNGRESGLFSWLLNTAAPKAMLSLYPIVSCG